ncbi:MAG: hypothetical protein KA369_08245 [Spirochaetes bacterium]|nr:hypothetical protein [Spirochaetota bacterium]
MANPEITQNTSEKITVMNPKYEFATLTASAAITVPAGQVLAFKASTKKYNLSKSGASAQANAKAIMAESRTWGSAGDKRVRILIGGEVRVDDLTFDGTDTIDTLPSGASDTFRTQLRGYGIIVRSDADIDEQDNS